MKFPIMIYDNLCLSCTKYAKYANKLAKGNITMIGHYTTEGKEIKQKIFPEGYDGLEMSWFVTDTHAFGGRKGLLQFLKYILSGKKRHGHKRNDFDFSMCNTDCRTVKGVFIRSCSILTCSKVLIHTLCKHSNE